ncbi:hypothetical protein EMIT0P100_80230 [Pseudomonas sp. IT-P100]
MALAQSKLVARTVEVPAMAQRFVAAHALAARRAAKKGVSIFMQASPGSFREPREER